MRIRPWSSIFHQYRKGSLLPSHQVSFYSGKLLRSPARRPTHAPILSPRHNQLSAPVLCSPLFGVVGGDGLLLPVAVSANNAHLSDSILNHYLLHGDGPVERQFLIGVRVPSVVRIAF